MYYNPQRERQRASRQFVQQRIAMQQPLQRPHPCGNLLGDLKARAASERAIPAFDHRIYLAAIERYERIRDETANMCDLGRIGVIACNNTTIARILPSKLI